MVTRRTGCGTIHRYGDSTFRALVAPAGPVAVPAALSGERGAMVRAYDKATGEELGAVPIPAAQTGSPMTYLLDGRQYLVLAVGAGTHPGELIAFALP